MKKQNIGLLGLSGNPTHQGHIASAWRAKRELNLDSVWLLINPHNPLKDPSTFAPFGDRLQLAQHEVDENPFGSDWLMVSSFEKTLRDRGVPNESVTMLPEFQKAYPHLNPVWMMGADNLAAMHTWGGDWNKLFDNHPMVIFARPGSNEMARNSVAARAHREYEVAHEKFSAKAGEWTFLDTALHPASSTEVRRQIALGKKPQHISENSYQHILKQGLYGANTQ